MHLYEALVSTWIHRDKFNYLQHSLFLLFCAKYVNLLPFVLISFIFCKDPIPGIGIGHQASNFLNTRLRATYSFYWAVLPVAQW